MISAKDVVAANKVLKDVVVQTPLDFDRYLSEKYGATIYLKRENMQKVRSFKIRGAYYAISQLSDEEKARGVVCASAGNHAQGVAYSCNYFHACNDSSSKDWASSIFWRLLCNYQIGR